MTVPLVLDEKDIAIINSMKNDTRKSFRQVGLELGLSTHVVTTRFDRLSNVGLIKSFSLIIDLSKIENSQARAQLSEIEQDSDANFDLVREGTKVTVNCDYFHGVVAGEPLPLKFADFQRYFCCITCRNTTARSTRAG